MERESKRVKKRGTEIEREGVRGRERDSKRVRKR